MAESSYPNPGVTQLQHERLLGRAMPSGVLGAPTDASVIYADNTGTREIRVQASRQAAVRGYGWQNDAVVVTKTLAANSSGSTRVDLVVLRLDRAAWTVTVQVVQGTPGAGAPSPTYGTGSSGTWELPLATVTVASGATTLAAGTVTNLAWYLGSDGQIRCTPTTRPPHEQGRSVWDTTKGWLVSDGTDWLVAVDDTDPVAIPITGGFAASRNVVSRRNGWAFGELTFTRPAAGMNGGTAYSVATLPSGFRPPATYQTIAQCPSAQVTCTVAIFPTGTVLVNPGVDIPANRSIVLASLAFPAA